MQGYTNSDNTNMDAYPVVSNNNDNNNNIILIIMNNNNNFIIIIYNGNKTITVSKGK